MAISKKNTNCESNNQSTTCGGYKEVNIYLLKKLRHRRLILKINRRLNKLYLQDHKKKFNITINLFNTTTKINFFKKHAKKFRRDLAQSYPHHNYHTEMKKVKDAFLKAKIIIIY